MDELIRQGLYLDEKKQIGAKFAIELLTGEIKKGNQLLEQETQQKLKEKREDNQYTR